MKVYTLGGRRKLTAINPKMNAYSTDPRSAVRLRTKEFSLFEAHDLWLGALAALLLQPFGGLFLLFISASHFLLPFLEGGVRSCRHGFSSLFLLCGLICGRSNAHRYHNGGRALPPHI